MKIKFSYLLKALFIFISLFFLGCETQEQVLSSSENFKKYQINFDEFNIDKNAKSALDQIKEEQIQNRQAKSGDAQQKIMYNKEFDFYIDTEKIVVVENSNYRQYTFPIYRTRENVKLENLVIKSKNNEPFKAYTIKYTLTALEKEIISNGGYVDVSDDTEISTLSKFAQLEDGTCWETVTVTSQATGWDDETWQQVPCPGSLSGGGGSGYIPNFNTGNGGIGSFPIGDTSGNGGGFQTSGGGSYSNINYIVATPTASLEQTQIKNFMNSLTDEQHDFLYPEIDLNNLSQNDNSTADSVIEYLNENDFSEESQDYVEEWIDYVIANYTEDNIEDLINVLDFMADGTIDGLTLPTPVGESITDMADFLDCIDLTQGGSITISADQPKAGAHNLYTSSGGVGHTFITIKQGTKVKSFGFYPVSGPMSLSPNSLTINPGDFVNVPGVFKSNQNTAFDVSITTTINSIQMSEIVNGVIGIAESNPSYNLGSMNCTDIGIIIFESTGISIPDAESTNPLWQGQTPGTLGQILRAMPLPTGTTRNTTGGNSPSNNCD
ncbi:hypothetical protein [Flavobacterium sp.]|uniref:hypothetical protein n=1 Tax=Flavobacterium sp. TaxID=239 RepID=UPI00260C2E0E|nr:hypothetical protein [Flavobacterium sp.]